MSRMRRTPPFLPGAAGRSVYQERTKGLYSGEGAVNAM
jgi:hypothetical protein